MGAFGLIDCRSINRFWFFWVLKSHKVTSLSLLRARAPVCSVVIRINFSSFVGGFLVRQLSYRVAVVVVVVEQSKNTAIVYGRLEAIARSLALKTTAIWSHH